MDFLELKYKMLSEEFSDIKLNDKQEYAYNLILKGVNVFLTGMAGTGKSLIVKMFNKLYRDSKIIGLTSTTGTSALIIGGTTLHSYLGIGLGKGSVDSLVSKIRKKSYLAKRWRNLETLIIDEVSMLSPDLFDKLEEIARRVRRSDLPFGGIQLVLTGDLLQLPCVNSEKFCFQSETWDKCIDEVVYMTEIVRQEDEKFRKCLNNVRMGIIDKDTQKILGERINIELMNDFGIKPTQIFSTNYNVDRINDEELDNLAEEGKEFYEYNMEMTIYPGVKKNREMLINRYKKYCNAVETLQICVGCQVMLLHNLEIESGLVNGSRGVVTEFKNDMPVVKFLNGKERIIDYHIWEVEDNDQKLMKVVQVPLKIAYALTIHRSQGLTLDYAEVDLENVFEYGQAYVALSRVKNLEGLKIIGIDYDRVKAHPEAIEFYKKLE